MSKKKLTCHYAEAGNCKECLNNHEACRAESLKNDLNMIPFVCTLPRGHKGDHVGCCGRDRVCAVWPQAKLKPLPRPFTARVEVDVGAEDEVDFIRLGKRLPREKGGWMIPVPKADLRLHFNKGELVEIEFMEKGMIPQRILRQRGRS